MPETKPKPRDAISPTGSATRGTVAGLIASAIATAVVTANPAVGPYAPAIIAVGTGVLTGLGNAARNRVASGEGGFGKLLAQLFSFLG